MNEPMRNYMRVGLIHFMAYPIPVERIGINDTFLECGLPEELAVKYQLKAKDLASAAKKAIARKVVGGRAK